MTTRKNQMIIDDKSNVCYLGDITKQDDGSFSFVATRVAIIHLYQVDEDGEEYLDKAKMTDGALEILSLKDIDSLPKHGSIDKVLHYMQITTEVSTFFTDEKTQEMLDYIKNR